MVSPPKYWHFAALTPSFTPVLLEDESIQAFHVNVGLYQGDYKILTCQKGRIYLTNQRLIYVDNEDPINCSVYVKLIDTLRERALDWYGGFLKSSPKITIFFKDLIDNEISKKSEEEIINWKCKICGFSNELSSKDYNFSNLLNPNLLNGIQLPNCENCGIGKSNKSIILSMIKKHLKKKAKKANDLIDLDSSEVQQPLYSNQCQICTFVNHPTMEKCEICGTKLIKKAKAKQKENLIFINTENNEESFRENHIKISFRQTNNNQEIKKFYNKIQEFINEIHLNDLILNSTKNENVQKIIFNNNNEQSIIKTGISAIESNQGKIINNNGSILENSLEDLSSLMSQAKELQLLIKQFEKILKIGHVNDLKFSNTLKESKSLLGINDNEAMRNLILNNNFNFLNKLNTKNPQVFYNELSRTISSFLINYVFLNETNSDQLITTEFQMGIISLLDLFTLYNRSLGFNNNLISPKDLLSSVILFKKLKLPLIFRKFKSGIQVVQDIRYDDNEILNKVMELLVKKKSLINEDYVGINIQTLSLELNLSILIIEEILQIGVMEGDLVIDEDISGINYYLNELTDFQWD